MKKRNRIIGLVLAILILWSFIGILNLEGIKKDTDFLDSWSIASKREAFIDRVTQHYLPFELLCYLAGAYFIYMLLIGWGTELFDGNMFKSIVYFGLTILGAIYSLHTYTIVGKVRAIVASRGEIPNINMLLYPFGIMFGISIIIQILKRSIEKEFYKEAELIKGSEYYNKWIDMSEKIKNIKK